MACVPFVGKFHREGDNTGSGRAFGLHSWDVLTPFRVDRRARSHQWHDGDHTVEGVAWVHAKLRGEAKRYELSKK
jgi:hypothetical protein